jgi:uncharacterized protein
MEIDSRPSDAIALAVRVSVPIFADEDVLERAGIWLEKEGNKLLPEDNEPPTSKKDDKKKVNEEEMRKKASAFYEFINTINLDDFDKRKS